MKIRQRIAHLKEIYIDVGQKINPGDKLGKMGNTGESDGAHFHVDSWIVEDWMPWDYMPRVLDFESGKIIAAPEHTEFLVGFGMDEGFLGCKPRITMYYHDSRYTRLRKKRHWGTDLIPSVTAKNVCRWNRSKDANCIYAGPDKPDLSRGYGNVIILEMDI